jgi:hypothetical protein
MTNVGRQVIKQPDGLYAVFSSGTDRWVAAGLTRDQYIEWRVEQAAKEARADAARLLDDVDAGLVYSGYTFGEANALSAEHGGTDLSCPYGFLGCLDPTAHVHVAEPAEAAVRPARLSADLTMSDGRLVHVPVVTAVGSASSGRIKVEIPYPDAAMPGIVIAAEVTNENLGVAFRRRWPGGYAAPGGTLTVDFVVESLGAEGVARVFGEWP